MSDRRQTWWRDLLARVGRAWLAGLTAMGSCWAGGYGPAVAYRLREQSVPTCDPVDVEREAARGLDEIEAYLAAVDERKHRRHRGRTP